jgi:hypothetical protein
LLLLVVVVEVDCEPVEEVQGDIEPLQVPLVVVLVQKVLLQYLLVPIQSLLALEGADLQHQHLVMVVLETLPVLVQL